MAKPRKLQGAAPAPAPTPAPTPAPAPAPVAAKPAPKREESEREEPKRREESKREKERSPPVKQAPPPALPGPTGDLTPPTSAERAATAARALAPQATAKAAKAAATTSSSPPVAKAAPGGPETTALYVPPEELEALKPYLTALGRVEDLRRQGNIGVLQTAIGERPATKGRVGPYRVRVTDTEVSPKQGREPLTRRPYASQVEMPTERELDIQAEGAKKMQQVMRDRKLAEDSWLENKKEILRLEQQLSAARDQITLDPTKSRAAQMEARAKEMEAISRQLKQMAAQQRGLRERILTKNATLREYGMTEKEIEPK